MTLKANVAMVSGLDEILHLGAQGVGLFRSEYLFMGRDNLPEEREQMEKIKEMKMERWAERLRGETADGNGIQ